MRVSIKNVGCLSDSIVECDGLTVICGINGTGKSTVLKAIYNTLCPAMYFDTFRDNQIYNTLSALGYRHLDDSLRLNIRKLWTDDDCLEQLNELDKVVGKDEQDRKPLEFVRALLERSEEGENRFYEAVVHSRIDAEFDDVDQFRTVGSKNMASVKITGGPSVSLKVTSRGIIKFDGDRKRIPSIVYWDSPFNADDARWSVDVYGDHRRDLCYLLHGQFNRNIILNSAYETNLRKFDDAVESVVKGRLVNTKQGLRYESIDGNLFSVKNVAAGIKVFATIRMLVDKGVLYEGSILMLDEPESHLHPQWINVLGDMIAILSRDLRIKVILTTHSPQLLMAVESSVSDFREKVRYYNIRANEDGRSTIEDVGDRIDLIYDEMSEPINAVASRFWG